MPVVSFAYVPWFAFFFSCARVRLRCLRAWYSTAVSVLRCLARPGHLWAFSAPSGALPALATWYVGNPLLSQAVHGVVRRFGIAVLDSMVTSSTSATLLGPWFQRNPWCTLAVLGFRVCAEPRNTSPWAWGCRAALVWSHGRAHGGPGSALGSWEQLVKLKEYLFLLAGSTDPAEERSRRLGAFSCAAPWKARTTTDSKFSFMKRICQEIARTADFRDGADTRRRPLEPMPRKEDDSHRRAGTKKRSCIYVGMQNTGVRFREPTELEELVEVGAKAEVVDAGQKRASVVTVSSSTQLVQLTENPERIRSLVQSLEMEECG